ncbi:MAG: hypothetical protein JO161_08515, partial [Planctomycetaceae bacterium]|nr:hypothetical protein [Planctomycetaceae bacterium]
MPDKPGLVVPVNVVGFCVSEADEQEVTSDVRHFAGVTAEYTNQTGSKTPAYLGSNVVRGFGDGPWKPLKAGVHLHWSLPDSLTRASVDQTNGKVNFPAAPNRWLVTRFIVDKSPPSVASWVIESDALNASPPDGQAPCTIPTNAGSGNGQDFAYLGHSTALAKYAPTALLEGPRTFKQVTGAELSCVSNGMPSFAAYYPEACGSFGFFDPRSDLQQAGNLMYVVTGWYDAKANDPATISHNITKTHAWAADDPPSYTLYSGMVQDIAWNPNRNYVLGQPNLQPISAQAAVGNTPIEALSAYFRALNHPDVPFFEQLLNAFQAGLPPSFSSPEPGLLAKLAESQHNRQFQAVDAGLIYTIVVTNPDETESEATGLPLPLADALNQLNIASQAFEEALTNVESFQWRMFADWYRYFQAPEESSSTIFNHASYLLAQWNDARTGLNILYTDAQDAVKARLDDVTNLLRGSSLTLKPGPAPRYWQPTDPAVLLASGDLSPTARSSSGPTSGVRAVLPCRNISQLVSQVTVSGTAISGATFAAICALPSTKLPYASDCTNLLIEACLFNTQIAASLSGQTDDQLKSDLKGLLANQNQTRWTIGAGMAPSAVEVTWWGPQNAWMPLFLQWSVNFAPLQSTENGNALAYYKPEFFSSNFTVDRTTGSFVSYTPHGDGSIPVDPASLAFPQTWAGQSVLSATAASNLRDAIEGYHPAKPVPTLEKILAQLKDTPTLVQPMSGFTAALLMQQQTVQLQIAVPDDSPFMPTQLTTETQSVVGPTYHVGPHFEGHYNPIRGGWFKISLQAVDVFGQKRDITLGDKTLSSVAQSESTTAYTQGRPVADVAYAAPRLAQPARLLFEWISASAAGVVEMNSHPATTPVCGWLLPNHLNGGFFLYDGAGRPLGSLELNGDQSSVVWQSAPGDDATIDLPIAQALANVNPTFKALALALSEASPVWFLAFWNAVDRVHDKISPDLLAANSGLPVLIGRPVAVAQAALRLDLRGRPALNQNWACLSDTEWTDTANDFPAVKFPVKLGDIDNLDDGLIGFFQPDKDSHYDLSTFFTEGADPSSTKGVVKPDQNTIRLTPTPKLEDPEPPPVAAETLPLLLLIDPRAPVHATTGILPTQELKIPPDVAADALSTLEMSFLVAPILKPAGGLALPVPREPGYAMSFVEQENASGKRVWRTTADISAPISNAVWGYTPQTLTEGWLRLIPVLLSFDILDASGAKAPLKGGANQTVILRVTNRKPAPVTFHPGTIFNVHFGQLVAQSDVAHMIFTADGWNFQPANDGPYWAATPAAQVDLPPGKSFDITVSGLNAVANAVQAEVSTAYYNVHGV